MSKNKISLQQAHDQWLEMVTEAGMDRHDHPAMAESWNNYVDALEKDGQLYALQSRYAPAWDEQMPGNGSHWDPLRDDREHVLESLGISVDCLRQALELHTAQPQLLEDLRDLFEEVE